MKTTLSGYSQFLVLLGIMPVLLMFPGSLMASQTSTDQPADGRSSLPSLSLIAKFTYSNIVQLQKFVGKIQAEFAKDRLGDQFYDDYKHRIAGLPRPPWKGLDKLSERVFLDKIAKELYIFRKFITEVKTLESQKKGSQYVYKMETINGQINRVIGNINDMQTRLGYTITLEPSFTLPTRMPFATPKKQYEWELGVLKSFLWWNIPVSSVFYQKSKQS